MFVKHPMSEKLQILVGVNLIVRYLLLWVCPLNHFMLNFEVQKNRADCI